MKILYKFIVSRRGKKMKKLENLLLTRPDIAKEWDYKKNKPLRPEDFYCGSSRKKVWWKCSKGHSWKTTIAARTKKEGTGCPICCNRKILKGYNDLQTMKPEVAKWWNFEKNGELKPTQVACRLK